MAGVTRFALDPASRRLDGGRVLLGGSPLVLFRLTPAGRRVVDSIEQGDPPPRGHERLTDRLLDAGAIHPLVDASSGPEPLPRMLVRWLRRSSFRSSFGPYQRPRSSRTTLSPLVASSFAAMPPPAPAPMTMASTFLTGTPFVQQDR